MRIYRLLLLGWVSWWVSATLGLGAAWAADAGTEKGSGSGGSAGGDSIRFNRDIRPILSDNCFACHGPDEKKRKARLRLDQREGLFGKGEHRLVVAPGDRSGSELFQRIRSTDDDERMPPAESGKRLSAAEVELLGRWIDEGAKWEGHWAFIKPGRPEIPVVKRADWARNEVDYFIVSKLEQLGLEPSPEAGREQLIRRASFDLTGLPPSVEEVDAFLNDHQPHAYERVVDRLLASPRYGERMALHWLDLARYADTHGYHLDSGRDMWKWREWVIESFNSNRPFDQFTVEQIAGDLLPGATLEQKLATGFNRNSMINFEGGAIPEEYLTQYIIDRVSTTSTVFLGLTMGCAQCHDHKFDPVSQKEFYQFYAYFNAVPENGLDGRNGNAAPLIYLPTAKQARELERLQAEVRIAEKELEEELPKIDGAQGAWELEVDPASFGDPQEVLEIVLTEPGGRTEAQKRSLQKYYREKVSAAYAARAGEAARRRKALADFQKTVPSSMVMEQMAQPRPTHVLVRGQYNNRGEKVEPGVLSVLHPLGKEAPPNRLGLAQWLVDPENPLTARVTVNRFWGMIMGGGLVKTANDFGLQSPWPSHPELLDWLTTEFVGTGWDVKRFMRLLVTSSAYRQSAAVTGVSAQVDPENRWYGRGPRFRLPAEMIRDNALAVSGLLAARIGGPSVFPYQPAGLWEELSMRQDSGNWSAQRYVQSRGEDLYRRTIYTFWKRTSPPPSLQAFDAPDRETCTVQRDRTTTPLQALILMNDPTYVEAARFLAERLMREAGPESGRRIEHAFRLVLGRAPKPVESRIVASLYEKQFKRFAGRPEEARKLLSVGGGKRDGSLDEVEHAAWTSVASMILNLDEAITKS